MEESTPATEAEDIFTDAFEEFPFNDPPSNVDSIESTASAVEDERFDPEPSPDSRRPARTWSSRSFSVDETGRFFGWNAEDSARDGESSEGSEIDHVHATVTTPEEKTDINIAKLKKKNAVSQGEFSSSEDSFRSIEENGEKSSTSLVSDDRVHDSISLDSSGELDARSSSFLVYIVGLLIKAIGFQFYLLIGFLRLPILSMYYTFAFIVNPFGTMKLGIGYLISKLIGLGVAVFKTASPFVFNRLNNYKSLLRMTLRFGWGLMWSVYVYIVLVGLLVSSFITSGLTMKFMVEGPLQMKQVLYFDYTKNSPMASFPIPFCPGVACVDCAEKFGVARGNGLRVIRPNHKFQATVSLTLPESSYNRNLGIFQVRVDCLSANGQVLASSRHPCMLPFESQPIHLLLTSLKVAPLLTGYVSESRTLHIKIRDFTEGTMPTTCLNVYIEPRAEFRPGAGIPEIYEAYLLLESDLPLLRRILWRWRRTVFIWTAMVFFMMGFLFTLCCCPSMLFPRARRGFDGLALLGPRHSISMQSEAR